MSYLILVQVSRWARLLRPLCDSRVEEYRELSGDLWPADLQRTPEVLCEALDKEEGNTFAQVILTLTVASKAPTVQEVLWAWPSTVAQARFLACKTEVDGSRRGRR